MPLSVDMRNLRIYTLLYDLQEVACCIVFWFLFSTQESKDKRVDVVQKQTRNMFSFIYPDSRRKTNNMFHVTFSLDQTPQHALYNGKL